MRSIVYNSSLKTEIGTLFITANEEKILGIHFVSDCPPDNENYLTKALKQELVEYFQKKRTTFSTFPLSLSSLEEKIFTKIITIPYGKTTTYLTLAKELGNVNDVKEIAKIIQNNPYLILIPCHRVLGKNKSLYNYQAGVKIKEELLKLEQDNCLNKKSMLN